MLHGGGRYIAAEQVCREQARKAKEAARAAQALGQIKAASIQPAEEGGPNERPRNQRSQVEIQ
eukprot:7216540-Pyramimonas_sp.AAC.1